MPSLTDILERLDDALNPIVVRDLRRAVQTRFVGGVLVLVLLGCLVVMGVHVLKPQASEYGAETGRAAFCVLYGVLVGACVFLLPLYTAARVASEGAQSDVDLFSITALRSRSIIWGRLSASLVLALLLFSVCAPFLVFTYVLRGVDLPSVVLLLVAAFVTSAFLTQFAVFTASVRIARRGRLGLGVLIAVAAYAGTGVLVSFASELTERGIGSFDGLWAVVALLATLGLLGTGLFFVLSVALIGPRSANRAFAVRLYVTVMWLLTFGAVAVWSVRARTVNAVVTWTLVSVSFFALGLFVAVGERDSYGPRVRRQIPRGALARLVAFPFFSGAANGVTWSIVMMGLTLAVGSLCSHLGGAWFGPDYRGMLQDVGYFAISGGIALQAVAYALTALLIWQRFWPKAREALTWSILVAIIAATFVLPVAGALTTSEYGSSGDTWLGTWYVLTPVGLSEGYSDVRHLTIEVATLWAGLMLFYNVFWIVERMRTFGRHGRDGRRARVEAARGALTVADPPDGGAP